MARRRPQAARRAAMSRAELAASFRARRLALMPKSVLEGLVVEPGGQAPLVTPAEADDWLRRMQAVRDLEADACRAGLHEPWHSRTGTGPCHGSGARPGGAAA